MILPVGDSPNPRFTPWVTYGLIALNVGIYLAMLPLILQAVDPRDPEVLAYLRALADELHLAGPQLEALLQQLSGYELLTFRLGFRPGSPAATAVFASMFLHGGLLHLAGNMLFLWIFGDNVEAHLGRGRFLLTYVLCGLAAVAGDAAIRWGSQLPSVGASGAISGVLGLYFVWFPHNRVRLWVLLFPFWMGTVEVRARVVLGFYVLIDNILPLLLGAGTVGGGVAYGAHVGGFLAGAALAGLASSLSLRSPVVDQDDPRDAVRLLTRGAQLEVMGHPRDALAAYRRAIALRPPGPERAQAHLGAARVLLNFGLAAAAYQHLRAALSQDRTAEVDAAARALLARLEEQVRHVPQDLGWP